jgi:hypothetical protein
MDVGCFLGGDLQHLVFDGVPSKNMYGVDIVSHWDVGYSLFKDKDHFKGHFIEADILSTASPSYWRCGAASISSLFRRYCTSGR